MLNIVSKGEINSILDLSRFFSGVSPRRFPAIGFPPPHENNHLANAGDGGINKVFHIDVVVESTRDLLATAESPPAEFTTRITVTTDSTLLRDFLSLRAVGSIDPLVRHGKRMHLAARSSTTRSPHRGH